MHRKSGFPGIFLLTFVYVVVFPKEINVVEEICLSDISPNGCKQQTGVSGIRNYKVRKITGRARSPDTIVMS